MDTPQLTFERLLKEHLECFRALSALRDTILAGGETLAATLLAGGQLLVCGNGGSAADAQHFAGEIIGRFKKERRAWPAVALTADSSILTAVANDYGYDEVFARQVEGLGRPGDALVGLSTSGASANVMRAARKARECGMRTVLLLGRDGGRLRELGDITIVVPSHTTARIQEVHAFVLHLWAELIENHLTDRATP